MSNALETARVDLLGGNHKESRVSKHSTMEKVWKNGTFLRCWCKGKLVQPLWRTVWRFLKKLKKEIPHDPTVPLLGIYPETNMI